jgi:hypothetical protein
MISADTAQLADKLPELERELVKERVKHAKLRQDEMDRHHAALERLTNEESKFLAEHARAARARNELMKLVALEVLRAAEVAGAEYRKAKQDSEGDRRERDAAAEVLAERKKDGATESEIEALEEQLEQREAAYAKALAEIDRLEKAEEKAKAEIEVAYQRIRREVLAKAKGERAGRA